MKKIIWIIAIMPLIATAIAVQFLPSEVPIHFNIDGIADKYGSKYLYFIVPIIIFLISLFWIWIIKKYITKNVQSKDRERVSYLSNLKAMNIVAVLSTLLISLIQYYLLCKVIIGKEMRVENLDIDVLKISCLLNGIIFIIIGNYLPKTKRNGNIGLRISWSEYNDCTWMKSNRFAGISLIVAGLSTIISTAFFKSYGILVLMLFYLTCAVGFSISYAHKVYLQELNKKE